MAHVVAGENEVLDGCRIDALEQRNDIETNAVTLCDAFGIGAVVDVGLSLLLEVLQNFFTAQAKERTYDAVVLGLHPG